MEYYSVIERNEVLMCVSQSMNSEHIMLNERKPATKGPMLHDYIYMTCPAQMNPQRQKAEWGFPGLRKQGITA